MPIFSRFRPLWPAAALAALLLAACASPPHRPDTPAGPGAEAAAPDASRLRIATWNMEHLAALDGVGCRPRTDADYARMRDYAGKIDADVIALEEVESAAAAARVFTPDKYDIYFSTRPASGRSGECRGQPGLHIRNQGVGFAVRKGLQVQRNPDLAVLALGNADLRWGVDITVHDRAGQPLRLLGLHLKSGCFDKADPTPVCSTVFKQADVLQWWIGEREKESVPYVLLGDWNRRLGKPNDKLWWELRHSTKEGVMLKDVPGGRRPSCSTFDSYIDHIVLSPKAAAAYRDGSFEEYTYEETGQPEHLSDHCAISVDLVLG